MSNIKSTGVQNISYRDILSLLLPLYNPESKTKRVLYLIGILLSPITLAGMLLFYIKAYRRFFRQHGEYPTLANLKPISRVSMVIGGILIWVMILLGIFIAFVVVTIVFNGSASEFYLPLLFMAMNLLICIIAFWLFRRWQNRVSYQIAHEGRFGSARFATESDMVDYERKKGAYFGGGIYAYPRQGHYLIMAGTRSGKFTDILAPNLLGLSGLQGSIFMIDVKGEAKEVTARFQSQLLRKRVLIISPWDRESKNEVRYNPLDLVSGETSPDLLVDNIGIIAEMIVPKKAQGEAYWENRARALISGLLLHIVTYMHKKDHHLGCLWKQLRLPEDAFNELLADMAVSDNEIVRSAANESINLLASSPKTFSSILSNALDATEFLKSPALRKSMESSSFDINTLSDGKTVIYVTIPPTHLESNSQWLRLVVTTAMMAVVKNHNKRVNFILDECAALGYLPILKTALSTFAGYNISLWSVFQDLNQIKQHYGESWESFINNSAVRVFFGVSDIFSSEYISKMMGDKTFMTYENERGDSKPNSSARRLATPDEVRRGSKNNIWAIIDQQPPACLPKIPYYQMPTLDGLHDPNPYYKPDSEGEEDSREQAYKEQAEILRRKLYGMDL